MKNLVIVFGGASVEHDVSIITALQAIDKLKEVYNIYALYLDFDNHFYLTDKRKPTDFIDKQSLKNKSKQVSVVDKKLYLNKKGKLKFYKTIDRVLNCCHGGLGEDGAVASFFKLNNLDISSSDNISSAICMNKFATKCYLSSFYIPVVKGVLIDKNSKAVELKKIRELKDNLIVKANNLGSSIGVEFATQKDVQEKIHQILALDSQVLVEERVENLIEYNCAVLKSDQKIILSEIEKVGTKDFFSYENKYCNNSSSREIPAKIDKELEELIYSYSKKAYELLKLSGVVRIDYLYDEQEKKLYLNEINTVPGSLAFYLFEGRGIDYITLAEMLLSNKKEEIEQIYFKTDILSKTSFQIK